jgi:cytidylate kinase
MENYSNKITITGDLGSGKSSVGKLLAPKLNFKLTSVGMIQREIATRYGLSTLELNRLSELNPDIDKEIDAVYESIQRSLDGYIIDARLAWHFVPFSLKIYLQTDSEIAAKRIFSDETRRNEKYSDISQALADLKARKESENRRFLREYGIDCSDLDNFDILIDTSYSPPEVIADLIVYLYKRYEQGLANPKRWISSKHPKVVKLLQETDFAEEMPSKLSKDGNFYHIFNNENPIVLPGLIPVEVVH